MARGEDDSLLQADEEDILPKRGLVAECSESKAILRQISPIVWNLIRFPKVSRWYLSFFKMTIIYSIPQFNSRLPYQNISAHKNRVKFCMKRVSKYFDVQYSWMYICHFNGYIVYLSRLYILKIVILFTA